MIKKLILVITIIFLNIVVVIFVYAGLRYKDKEKFLDNLTSQINSKIKFRDGEWDLSSYNSDQNLVGYYPLYIFTNDGFILDRRNVINGFLDSSDFNQLLKYEYPQTIDYFTGYKRRIFSLPIENSDGQVIAVVAASYLNPNEKIIDDIDKKLYQATDIIKKNISVKNNNIEILDFDEKLIGFDVAYNIVDKRNIIIKKSLNVNSLRRVGGFIDPSYLRKLQLMDGIEVIRDLSTKEIFLIYTKPLILKGSTEGFIVVGENINDEIYFLFKFFSWLLVSEVITFLLIIFVINKYFVRKYKENIVKNPQSIIFDEGLSVLYIDNYKLKIMYGTNQYYLLKSLFSNPKKRWESDEIMKKFGELDERQNRKVYDSMVNINNKLSGHISEKLILNMNKSYQLNPNLPCLKSSK